MTELDNLSAFVAQKIEGFNFPKEPVNLYDPLRYFMTLGGKRMRPILTLMSADLFGVQKEESIHAALAIELFHNFSLIHDDIMDNAPVRRGKTTVHEKWNNNCAILSGDVLFVEAYKQLAFYKDERLAQLFDRFNTTAQEVCEGQQMDMDFETRNTVSKAEYIEMIRLKTSVLLGCALEFGAILGQQSTEVCQHIYSFGVDLGLAFQIQDDLLDLYADPDKFGKQVGGDILTNKKTLLLISALATNDSRVLAMMQANPDQAKIETAKSLFLELGIVSKMEEEIAAYYAKAMNELGQLNLSNEQLAPLYSLADFLIKREY
jgi:geranylgeranyl diphosphate synthase type II